ncbi:MAG: PQQ-dependent sugar dehydrogenase [Fimbriimonadaceae bacterium]|nr:PQQ-dependent sugar dehydrogenase [Fimbriimonadaceae bacterium]
MRTRFAPTFLVVALFAGFASAQSGLRAREVLTGLESPIAVIQDPTSSTRRFVVQQGGKILVLEGNVLLSRPFLDLSSVVTVGGERGLLGLTFPPDYAQTRYFYVNFSAPGSLMQLARYQRNPNDPTLALPGSRRNILRTVRPFFNHNAGTIAFGPDGYLYLPTGDGGSAGDPSNYSQNPQSLLGKMLRIDPRTDGFPSDPLRNYAIPPTNPFLDGEPITALPEVFDFGLRNPWKFSFDDLRLLGNGAMVIADVGQDTWEEVNYVPRGQSGHNFGWARREGNMFYAPGPTAFMPDTRPALVYDHSQGSSITGGHVYRGLKLGRPFFGRYFYGDFVSGRFWSCKFAFDSRTGRWNGIDIREHTQELELGASLGNISSLDVDSSGEAWIVDYQGRLLAIDLMGTALRTVVASDGRIASGGARHAVQDDQHLLKLAPVPAVPGKTGVIAMFKTTTPNIATLGFEAVGQMSAGGALLRVSFRRWSDDQFVQVRAYRMDALRRRFQVTDVGNSGDYIRNDGRVELKLTTEQTSGVSGAQTWWNVLDLKVSQTG